MAERNVNRLQPSRLRAARAASRQTSAVTRIQRSLPSRMWAPTTPSPSASFMASSRPRRSSSSDAGEVGSTGSGAAPASGAAASVPPGLSSSGLTPSPSADDNGFTLPALGHVLVLDALLEEHDA